ncbi:hypothetical protein ACQPYH_39745 [Kribbella sp. CA-245084]|uniref:hypothetical protein n=1 Tax=Kribbella sp. CA-245084 TaxID=3239940 RepID=UPI003D89CC10
MAHYLFNLTGSGQSLPDQAAAFLRSNTWPIDPTEPHAQALASGDQVLIYLGPPERVFIAHAELASPWTDATQGVLLTHVERWTPPIPMETVLAKIPPTENAQADFPRAVVRITRVEYESALSAATN